MLHNMLDNRFKSWMISKTFITLLTWEMMLNKTYVAAGIDFLTLMTSFTFFYDFFFNIFNILLLFPYRLSEWTQKIVTPGGDFDHSAALMFCHLTLIPSVRCRPKSKVSLNKKIDCREGHYQIIKHFIYGI